VDQSGVGRQSKYSLEDEEDMVNAVVEEVLIDESR
jgi:hypothetical protein